MSYLLALTILLAPTYAIKFSLLGFPTNLLLVWLLAFWIIFTAYLTNKKLWGEFFFLSPINKKLLIAVSAFFLAGIISLSIGGITQAKLGQFIVLFLQPISVFFIGRFIIQKKPNALSIILYSLYFILALAGAYAILQYFTLVGLPPEYWGNSVEPKRALSFFSHPNFYSLFSAPLLALLVPDLIQNLKFKILNLKLLAWLLGAAGLFFSLSRAGWLGLLAAIIVFLIVAADKRTRLTFFGLILVGIISVFSVTTLRYRIILPLLGEKSAVSRISLWDTGWKAVKETPVLGMGLTGFSQNWSRLNADPNIDSHNFPHNVFLNFWVETGLLGLISFIAIASLFIYRGLKNTSPPAKEKTDHEVVGWSDYKMIKLGIALFLITLITQGFIDNPYFKNDLAVVFWVILSLI